MRDGRGKVALRDRSLLILLIGVRETFGAAGLFNLVVRAPTWSSLSL